MHPRLVVSLGSLASLLLALGGLQSAHADAAASATPHLDRLDSGLALLASGGPVARPGDNTFQQSAAYELSPSGTSVLVDVYVDGSLKGTEKSLRDLGMVIDATYPHEPYTMVEGYLPVDRLVDATAVAGTQAVVGVPADATNEGAVLSEGDAAHEGPVGPRAGYHGCRSQGRGHL